MNHSFHPRINPSSDNSTYGGLSKPEDKLLMRGMVVKDKLDQRRATELFKIQNAYSFQPNINENSRKIVDQRNQFFNDFNEYENYSYPGNNGNAQFHHLYMDAMKRVDRHNNIYSKWIDSEWTFQPDIGKTRLRGIHPRYDQINDISNKSMMEKLRNENIRRNFDPETGQPFFVPKVGRSPKDRKNRNSKSIGDIFYDRR